MGKLYFHFELEVLLPGKNRERFLDIIFRTQTSDLFNPRLGVGRFLKRKCTMSTFWVPQHYSYHLFLICFIWDNAIFRHMIFFLQKCLETIQYIWHVQGSCMGSTLKIQVQKYICVDNTEAPIPEHFLSVLAQSGFTSHTGNMTKPVPN